MVCCKMPEVKLNFMGICKFLFYTSIYTLSNPNAIAGYPKFYDLYDSSCGSNSLFRFSIFMPYRAITFYLYYIIILSIIVKPPYNIFLFFRNSVKRSSLDLGSFSFSPTTYSGLRMNMSLAADVAMTFHARFLLFSLTFGYCEGAHRGAIF